MKTNTLLAKAAMMLTMAVGLALSACSNEPGLKTAVGDYDYRIAGTARIYFADSNEERFVTLTPESGTMTVTRSKESDKCNATLYADNGNTYEMVLFFTHDTVWIDNPIFRDIIVKIDDKDELFNIRISGEGQVLNNGDLNMRLGYSGRSRNTDHNWTLTANPVSVHLNARKR
ncbi:MAG: hypothetical protein IKQ48_06560 [Paludibacteraceae bacterium]|nr:hypothetical protein [Paludibacteraceae bacterium]